MNEWISVKERLPNLPVRHRLKGSSGVPVIVHQPSNGERLVFEAFYGKRVTDSPAFYLYGAILEGIDAWQPLPEPPK